MGSGWSCLAGCAGPSGDILVEIIRGTLRDQGLSGCEDPLRYDLSQDGQVRLTIRCPSERGDFGRWP